MMMTISSTSSRKSQGRLQLFPMIRRWTFLSVLWGKRERERERRIKKNGGGEWWASKGEREQTNNNKQTKKDKLEAAESWREVTKPQDGDGDLQKSRPLWSEPEPQHAKRRRAAEEKRPAGQRTPLARFKWVPTGRNRLQSRAWKEIPLNSETLPYFTFSFYAWKRRGGRTFWETVNCGGARRTK